MFYRNDFARQIRPRTRLRCVSVIAGHGASNRCRTARTGIEIGSTAATWSHDRRRARGWVAGRVDHGRRSEVGVPSTGRLQRSRTALRRVGFGTRRHSRAARSARWRLLFFTGKGSVGGHRCCHGAPRGGAGQARPPRGGRRQNSLTALFGCARRLRAAKYAQVSSRCRWDQASLREPQGARRCGVRPTRAALRAFDFVANATSSVRRSHRRQVCWGSRSLRGMGSSSSAPPPPVTSSASSARRAARARASGRFAPDRLDGRLLGDPALTALNVPRPRMP
jgi:hypothetical protein